MKKARYDLGAKLSKPQVILGWCYLPMYLFLTSWAIQFLLSLLGMGDNLVTLNSVYFLTNLAVVLLGFSSWLKRSFRGFTEHFWQFIQTLILGFALYYISQLVLSAILVFLLGEQTVPNNDAVVGLVQHSQGLMALLIIIIAPITEEVLVRGVIFGTLHRTNRYLAYAVSILFFSMMHVWQHISGMDVSALVFNICLYLPAGVALGWTYEKSGTIWCPITLHAIINAISYGVIVTF
jgi:membrane protease YdiL (CAAX protease family)